MNWIHALRTRIRPGAFVVVTLVVVAATYVEFVYRGPPSLYTVALWLVVVPWLFSATVRGVRDHPSFRPLSYGCLVAIGILQYLDGDWTVLAGIFVLAGGAGLTLSARDRLRT